MLDNCCPECHVGFLNKRGRSTKIALKDFISKTGDACTVVSTQYQCSHCKKTTTKYYPEGLKSPYGDVTYETGLALIQDAIKMPCSKVAEKYDRKISGRRVQSIIDAYANTLFEERHNRRKESSIYGPFGVHIFHSDRDVPFLLITKINYKEPDHSTVLEALPYPDEITFSECMDELKLPIDSTFYIDCNSNLIAWCENRGLKNLIINRHAMRSFISIQVKDILKKNYSRIVITKKLGYLFPASESGLERRGYKFTSYNTEEEAMAYRLAKDFNKIFFSQDPYYIKHFYQEMETKEYPSSIVALLKKVEQYFFDSIDDSNIVNPYFQGLMILFNVVRRTNNVAPAVTRLRLLSLVPDGKSYFQEALASGMESTYYCIYNFKFDNEHDVPQSSFARIIQSYFFSSYEDLLHGGSIYPLW